MKITLTLALLCIIGTALSFPAFVPVLFHSQLYTLFTSVFAHAGLTHLVYNLFGLIIFGIILEKLLGWKWYSVLIFVSIGFSAFGYLILSNPYIGAVGISGVIFGLIGALAVLKPKMIVVTPYGPLPMVVAAILWIVIEYILLGANDSIAHSAHLFGLIGGLAFAGIYKLDKRVTLSLLVIFPILFLIPVPGFPLYHSSCVMVSSELTYHFSYAIYNCTNYSEIGIYTPNERLSIDEKLNNGRYFLSQLGNYSINKEFNTKDSVIIYGTLNKSNFNMNITNNKYVTLYLIKVY